MALPDGQAAAPTSESMTRVTDAAQTALDRTKDVAQDKLAVGIDQAVNSAGAASDALRRAAEDVSNEHAWIGTILRKSADGLEVATQALQGGDIESGAQELTSFARRQPALFLGGALAVGFALSRIGKTAVEQATSDPDVSPPPQSGALITGA